LQVHSNVMMATMLTVMDAIRTVQLVIIMGVLSIHPISIQLLVHALLLVQLDIIQTLRYQTLIPVSLATTLVAHALLPLHVILVLLQATES
jgi:hypothetical protein